MTGESICLWCGDIIASDHSQVDFCVKCHENLRDMEEAINNEGSIHQPDGYIPLYIFVKSKLKQKRGVS